MNVVLAHVKPVNELINPCDWEIELAGQEVMIDIGLTELVEYEPDFGIWCLSFDGDVNCITKRHLTNWEVINWEV